jgi:hypothetical protein
METLQVFIFDVGWIFFAAWGMALAALSVIAFGRDIRSYSARITSDRNHPSADNFWS